MFFSLEIEFSALYLSKFMIHFPDCRLCGGIHSHGKGVAWRQVSLRLLYSPQTGIWSKSSCPSGMTQ